MEFNFSVILLVVLSYSCEISSSYITYIIDWNSKTNVELDEIPSNAYTIKVESAKLLHEKLHEKSQLEVEQPSGHKLAVFIDNMNITHENPCKSYITLTGIDNEYWNNRPMCGAKYEMPVSFSSSDKHKEIRITYQNHFWPLIKNYIGITIVAYTIKDKFSNKCLQSNYFGCGNNRCIPSELKCDGYDNCGDLTDEKYCNEKESQSGYVVPSLEDKMPVGLIFGIMLAVFVVLAVISAIVIRTCKKNKSMSSTENIHIINPMSSCPNNSSKLSPHTSYSSQHLEPPSAPPLYNTNDQTQSYQGYQGEVPGEYSQPPPSYNDSLVTTRK